MEDRVNNVKSSSAERGTTLEELQENVNKKRDEDETNKLRPRLCGLESPKQVCVKSRVMLFDELSSRDSKGLNYQDCEVGSKSMRRVLTSLVIRISSSSTRVMRHTR